ncbi:CBO0543 family protein [Ammoniphilus sp. CFH 90114]|uniref:CBO0543 family protein n=1 Tax=Ammoniphilus sp. CFH 90114 TaxID=2493665 RepID=UPI00100FBA7E|nr:CBO0543 family protein [Ammoniphilus sp. CFH 90114]RXT03946.1 hypothetical protein EIZ39_22590 [Ammoniphilus sp. CFH 90114]
MNLERSIIIFSWIISIILLKVFVPKSKKREAWVIFLFMQTFNWYFGLIVVEYGLIQYPVVLFEAVEKANRTSFLFEFMAFPVLCVIFTLYLPKSKPWHRRPLYYIGYTALITLFEVIFEKHTDLIQYIHWTWYYTFGTVLIAFYICTFFFTWYSKFLIQGEHHVG